MNIKGYNNGTWGFGMFGGLIPTNMNGPLGYPKYPLPINQSAMINSAKNPDNRLNGINLASVNTWGPNYNSQFGNFPSYNEKSFEKVSGYELRPGFFGSSCAYLN